jgi:hypothetical protein
MKKLKKIVLAFCIFLSSFLVFLVPFGARTASLDSRFGVNAFVLNRYDWREWDKPISSMKELGVSWSREEFIWELIEPEKGAFEWNFYDQAINSLSSSKVNILGIIDYSAPWATEDPNRANADKYMPNIDDWKNYIGKIVDRYGSRVKYWQIWNEPNISVFFKPAPNASQYLELLQSAYEVIKQKDPNAQVLMAGTSGVDVGYLRELKNLGASSYFDILAVHPYSFDFISPPEGNFLTNMKNAQQLASEFGNKSIWLTEFGWPTNNTGIASEDLQAKYLSRIYLMSYQFPNVKKLFWYDFRNDGDDKNDRENNFGLINRDYTRKKSFYAYKNLISILEGSQLESVNTNGENGVYDYSFSKLNSKIRVIWKISGSSNFSINDNSKNIKVLDFVGSDITPKNQESPTLVNISDFPIFIITGNDYNLESKISYSQNYEYEYIDQSPNISLKNGEEREVWIKLKNTGKTAWGKESTNPVILGTSRNQDRSSPFFVDGNWIGANRVASTQSDVVRSGEVATFIFHIKANNLKNGLYREYFCPVAEGFSWMKDIGIYWDFVVNDSNESETKISGIPYSYQYIDQTEAKDLVSGETEKVYLRLKNTGTTNWEKGKFNLGTSRTKDRESIFDNNWSFKNRILLNQDTVKPGEIGTFEINFTAPSEKGIFKEYFRPVVDSVAWLDDIGIYWQVKIK